MTWQPEIDEIRDRRLKALEMGGAEKVARQHAQGKLSARERIAGLLDQGSFTELGMLATHQSQRPEMQGLYTAADGVIIGYGRIAGREVLVGVEDFTVMGGSVGLVLPPATTRSGATTSCCRSCRATASGRMTYNGSFGTWSIMTRSLKSSHTMASR